MCHSALLLVLLAAAGTSLARLPLSGHFMEVPASQLQRCLERLFYDEPFPYGPLLVISPPPHGNRKDIPVSTVISALLHASTQPLVLLTVPTLNSYKEPICGYVFLLTEPGLAARRLESLLSRIESSGSWKPRLPVLVILLTSEFNYQVNMEGLLQVLDNYNALYSTVLTVSFGQKVRQFVPIMLETNIKLYTWFPYKHGRCRDLNTIPELLGTWNFTAQNFDKNFTLFVNKLSRKLNDCNVRASTYNLQPFVSITNESGKMIFSGYEVSLFKLIGEARGFRPVIRAPKYSGPQWGERMAAASWSGVLGDLVAGRADVAFGGLHNNAPASRPLETTAEYLHDALTWFVPRAAPLPAWTSIASIMSLASWCILVALHAFMAISISFFSNRREIASFRNLDQAFFNTMAMIFLGSTRMPRTFRTKILFVIWMIFTQIFNFIYQSILTSRMMHPRYEEQILNELQLMQSGMKCGGLLPFKIYLENIRKPGSPQISYVCSSIDECMDRIGFAGDIALLTTKVHTYFMSSVKYIDSSGKPLFIPFEDNVFSYYVVMHMPKGSPLLPLFSETILLINQAGLMIPKSNYFMTKMKYASLANANRDDEEEPTQSMKLSHFVGAYVMYAFLITLSFIALNAEILYCQWLEKRLGKHFTRLRSVVSRLKTSLEFQ